MKFLIDMNLSPAWVSIFEQAGWEARHWSQVGINTAADASIMVWAKEHGFIVFTHDLDFGKLLALTAASGPSVLQVRTIRVLPRMIGNEVVAAILQFKAELENGALITVDVQGARARVLPILKVREP